MICSAMRGAAIFIMAISSRATLLPRARHFHCSIKTLEGLVWRPRLGGEGVAYVFFGDRVSSSYFKLTEDRTRIHVEPGRSLISGIAAAAHIKIIAT